ncbi:DUF1003 domain-containing protein [Sphingomonas cannabina]|uniref:DUF1003 domain-containing protein n=1 Tax=Sphingomonas cannabina TaxID=2899123 RepID=UPI001F362EF1|nr:DUF1003 domain-containing protein [Sphingomonas cannabina]UIJ45054.1 DUF1003 domain-containing protein [Sphingomonas cannabina]
MPDPAMPEMTATLRDNIARLTERQRAEASSAPFSQQLADRITRFTGSMTFVAIHLILYGAWIAINLGWIPGVPRFDPSFVVLAMEASVEAIFLSTFVLISQNRMATEADRRANLDLHINLLAEHELTRLAGLIERIAERVGIPVDDAELEEIKRDVEPVEVLDALDTRKRAEGLEP